MKEAIEKSVEKGGAKFRRSNPLREILGGIGRRTIAVARPTVLLGAMLAAVIRQSVRPLNWRRTLGEEFLRQCRLVGAGGLPFTFISALLIGLAMVFQLLYWLALAGQRELIGKIVVMVMIREVAPLLVAMIVIGRNGLVNMVELGAMRADGQIRMLDAQGVDPFLFFILPRSIATAVSMFCLNIVFIFTALATGYLAGKLAAPSDRSPVEFLNEVLAHMSVGDYAIIVLKPVITGLLITVITCSTGLFGRDRTGGISEVLPIGFVKSILAVFLVSGTLSLML